MNEIEQLQTEISQKIARLNELRKNATPTVVPNYTFKNLEGSVTLLELFADKAKLFAIHNMGQGCRYCTMWADGINAFLPHLESEFAVVLLSKDPPETQRTFANGRGWRFRMASHGGGDYIREQSVVPDKDNMPGMVCYTREGGQVHKLNSVVFGPGDLYCSIWHILSLAGVGEADWTPQYAYWKRPQKMDDGGLKILE
ncbi:MAG TPA: DUF899 family protein [Pirellulales bacterium]|nr:DUF899 family protein [Pirellulales bacterium]